MRSSIAELEAKLEGVLESVTEDFAVEVGREQQHLMLMQARYCASREIDCTVICSVRGGLSRSAKHK